MTVLDSGALAAALQAVEDEDIPWLCLGAGSNLLVADEGYPGVVVKLDEGFHYVEGLPSPGDGRAAGDEVVVTVGGGAYLARLAAVVAENGLAGLEFACGIPGSVGGGVAMNAGAHGRWLGDVAAAVECTDKTGAVWLDGDDLQWSYRHCSLPEKAVVTAVKLRLERGDSQEILDRHRALLRARRSFQPRGMRTFGSVFKNPPGDAAGKLLDEAGLKGVRRGGAEVSSVHANFIVNLGDATTADILALMTIMHDTVLRTAGVSLEPEVRLLGAAFPWKPDGEPGSGSVSGRTDMHG